MNKNEILEKSRQSKKDEGFENQMNKSARNQIIISTILSILIVFFKAYIGENWFDVFGLLFAGTSVAFYHKYKFTKDRKILTIFLMNTVFATCYIIMYIIYGLRKI